MYVVNLGISLKSGEKKKNLEDQIQTELLLGILYLWVLFQILIELLLGIFNF